MNDQRKMAPKFIRMSSANTVSVGENLFSFTKNAQETFIAPYSPLLCALRHFQQDDQP